MYLVYITLVSCVYVLRDIGKTRYSVAWVYNIVTTDPEGWLFRVAISTAPDPQGSSRVDILKHPYTTAACAAGVTAACAAGVTVACAAGVVTVTTRRDSSRCRYHGNRRTHQLELDCRCNWVTSTQDVYKNTWKCGELTFYFSPSAGGQNKHTDHI